MITKLIKEIMVPISDYVTIHEDASMAKAIQSLESENKSYGDSPYRHQSLVVTNRKNYVVGRLSQVDIMRAMEPRYCKIGSGQWVSRSVLSKEVLVTLRESFKLWEQPLETLCSELNNLKVKDFMQVPTEGEFVNEDDTFNVACHRIIMGRHHSLLVTKNKEIVGILRSTDLFNDLYDVMVECDYLK